MSPCQWKWLARSIRAVAVPSNGEFGARDCGICDGVRVEVFALEVAEERPDPCAAFEDDARPAQRPIPSVQAKSQSEAPADTPNPTQRAMPGMQVADENKVCTAGFAAKGNDADFYLLTSQTDEIG